MRPFLTKSPDAVEAVLGGIIASSRHPLEQVPGHLALLHRGNPSRRVRILVGGGSGHEPLFLGAVGPGMADAAIAGQVFAAPNPMSVQAAIEACTAPSPRSSVAPEGSLLIYGNYSGDVLNFGFAADEIRQAGGRIDEVRVHDDIASRPPAELEKRRGIAGDIFVIKTTCAAADRGLPFDDVLRIARKACLATRSLGVALGAASSIDTGKPMFDLPAGQIEIGMGLHGEMGVKRSAFEPAATLVPHMLEMILADYAATGSRPARVAAMVNGLGSTTILELLAVSARLREALGTQGVAVSFLRTGQFATSLDMAGFSITLMALDSELEPLLDAPCSSFCYSNPA
ncbi:dihydroxyacetone kinase [Opitutaceae bacterium TAV1]|nr:dihydroxyacetone kinase [Opitutaceae bacterium TAV1]